MKKIVVRVEGRRFIIPENCETKIIDNGNTITVDVKLKKPIGPEKKTLPRGPGRPRNPFTRQSEKLFDEGKDYGEVSHELGISVDSARGLYNNWGKKMKEKIKDTESE